MRNANVIPPMTHPDGEGWKQPPTDAITIDDETATMSHQTFKALLEYSTTRPTGAYEGKMWKRHDGAYDREFMDAGGNPVWMLCWYGESDRPGMVSNNHRRIVIR